MGPAVPYPYTGILFCLILGNEQLNVFSPGSQTWKGHIFTFYLIKIKIKNTIGKFNLYFQMFRPQCAIVSDI